jgi:hypothetical protein
VVAVDVMTPAAAAKPPVMVFTLASGKQVAAGDASLWQRRRAERFAKESLEVTSAELGALRRPGSGFMDQKVFGRPFRPVLAGFLAFMALGFLGGAPAEPTVGSELMLGAFGLGSLGGAIWLLRAWRRDAHRHQTAAQPT